MKKPTKKEIEDKMLKNLNDFMKDFNIEEINFGNTHKIKKTDNEKANDVYIKKNKKA
jgi:hypothetical protein